MLSGGTNVGGGYGQRSLVDVFSIVAGYEATRTVAQFDESTRLAAVDVDLARQNGDSHVQVKAPVKQL